MDRAAELAMTIPPFVSRVGLFVDAPQEYVAEAISRCGLDTVQLHGDEPPEFCGHFLPSVRVLKAFRVRNTRVLDELLRYDRATWLLDAYVPGQAGGTGTSFNWGIAMEAKMLGRPIILAGGLNQTNVADAIRRVRPYAVDVSSGVEFSPGRKDPEKVKAFIQAAHSVA